MAARSPHPFAKPDTIAMPFEKPDQLARESKSRTKNRPTVSADGNDADDRGPVTADTMHAPSTESGEPHCDATNAPVRTQPPSFAQLAKRLTGWTSNLIATAIIVLLAATFGIGGVKLWVRAQQDSTDHGSNNSRLDDPWVPLQTAEARFYRRESVGGRDASIELLIDQCETLARDQARKPLPRRSRTTEAFLDRIRTQQPSRIRESGLATYVLDGPVTLVVTIATKPAIFPTEQVGRNDSEFSPVVLSWGLAMQGMPSSDLLSTTEAADSTHSDVGQGVRQGEPPGQDRNRTPNSASSQAYQWTLFSFPNRQLTPFATFANPTPATSNQGEPGPTARLPRTIAGDLRLPPDSNSAFSIGQGTSQQFVHFSTERSVTDCVEHFDGLFVSSNIERDDWQREADTWSLTIRQKTGEQLTIRLDAINTTQTNGFISITSTKQ